MVRILLPPPIRRITTRHAQAESPEVIPVREEQLPQPIPWRHSPHAAGSVHLQHLCIRGIADLGRAVARDASRVFVAAAMPQVEAVWGQARLADVNLTCMHLVAPLFEREERDGVVDVGHAAVGGAGLVLVGEVELSVDEVDEGLVSDSRFAEGGDLGCPAAGFELEGCEGGDGAAKAVADERDLVVRVLR